MKKPTTFKITGLSRYDFDAKGNAYSNATSKALTLETAVKFPAFRLINDEGKRQVVKVDFIKEQAPIAEKPEKETPYRAIPKDDVKNMKAKVANPTVSELIDAGALVKPETFKPKLKAISLLRWRGIHAHIVEAILSSLIPANVKKLHYFFIGDGSLFFNLIGQFKQAYIYDTNKYVLAAYEGVKRNPKEVNDELGYLEDRDSIQLYKERREVMLSTLVLPLLAANMIYTNQAAIDGFYWRNNNKGMMNLPYSNKNHQLPQKADLFEASELLQASTFHEIGEGGTLEDMPHLGKTSVSDFVVIDMPAETMHRSAVLELARELHKTGAKVLIHCQDFNTNVLGFSDKFIGNRKFLKNY